MVAALPLLLWYAPADDIASDFYDWSQDEQRQCEQQEWEIERAAHRGERRWRQDGNQECCLGDPGAAAQKCMGEINLPDGDEIAEQGAYHWDDETQEHDGCDPGWQKPCQQGSEADGGGEVEVSFTIQVSTQPRLPLRLPGDLAVGNIGNAANE